MSFLVFQPEAGPPLADVGNLVPGSLIEAFGDDKTKKHAQVFPK